MTKTELLELLARDRAAAVKTYRSVEAFLEQAELQREAMQAFIESLDRAIPVVRRLACADDYDLDSLPDGVNLLDPADWWKTGPDSLDSPE